MSGVTYQPYSQTDMESLLNDVREVSNKPYMLHAAFVLSCIFEAIEFDDDNWHHKHSDMFGMRIPKSILESIIKNANSQFVEAARENAQIDVWGRPYTVRKPNAFDPNRLNSICRFETEGDDYIISKDGVLDLYGISQLEACKECELEFKECRSYLRKVIYLAEDDDHNGWDSLTDMEVTMYLWALFYRKHNEENYVRFREMYHDDIYTTLEDDKSCWNAMSLLGSKPNGLYAFSAKKMRTWNKDHNQISSIDNIDEDVAVEYWYNVASKKNFK